MNLRDYERESIRRFVQMAADAGFFAGRVLDYGCGQQPYRAIVEEAGGEYLPFDRKTFPGSVVESDVGDAAEAGRLGEVDTVLCTQVLQYVPHPRDVLWQFRALMRDPLGDPTGTLVLTYPTNWPEVEDADLHRFTRTGMELLLRDAGFTVLRHDRRGMIHDPAFHSGRQKRITATGESLALGYGVVASA